MWSFKRHTSAVEETKTELEPKVLTYEEIAAKEKVLCDEMIKLIDIAIEKWICNPTEDYVSCLIECELNLREQNQIKKYYSNNWNVQLNPSGVRFGWWIILKPTNNKYLRYLLEI